MTPAHTTLIKYIYLDVVAFSSNRSAEAQADIIATLNNIVSRALADVLKTPPIDTWPEALASVMAQSAVTLATGGTQSVIYLPTGDGLCIALVNPLLAYDIHIVVALKLLAGVARHNAHCQDVTRRFDIRIGLNQNVDNLIRDINDRPNVAGAGINLAQRVMSFADGGQILVSQSVHDVLAYHERYMGMFDAWTGVAKHQQEVTCFQYIEKDCAGLNIDPPSAFQEQLYEEPPLSLFDAYWIAHITKHYEDIATISRSAQHDLLGACALLYRLASDSRYTSEQGDLIKPLHTAFGDTDMPFTDRVAHYHRSDTYLLMSFSNFVRDQLEHQHRCFSVAANVTYRHLFVSDYGKEKLKREHPEIWQEFALE